jgi:hypothetical protein
MRVPPIGSGVDTPPLGEIIKVHDARRAAEYRTAAEPLGSGDMAGCCNKGRELRVGDFGGVDAERRYLRCSKRRFFGVKAL